MKDPIVQEYVGTTDEEYTMTIFSDGRVVNNIVFKRELGLGSMSRYVELVHSGKCDDIATKIAANLDLKGSINVQMRKRGDEYFVFEINPRISSTIGFRQMIGFNDVEWWIDLVLNNEINSFDVKYDKVIGIRGVEEKIIFV